MNLLNDKPKEAQEQPEMLLDSSAMEVFNEENPEPILPKDLEPEIQVSYPLILTEIVRTCVQCDFNFVQDIHETLQCICPNCRKAHDERVKAREVEDEPLNLPIQKLPSLPSVHQVLENLKW
jgi:hypothetical protein